MKLSKNNNGNCNNNNSIQSNNEIQSALRTSYNINYNKQSQDIANRGNNYNDSHIRNEYAYKSSSPNSNQYHNTNTNGNANVMTTNSNRNNLPSSYRVFDTSLQDSNDAFEKKQKMLLMKHQPDNWTKMINRTSAENSICNRQSRISTSKTFQSKIFPQNGFGKDNAEKRIAKETEHNVYSTTSQIYSLPGCVKRNPIKIKDDKVVPKYNYGRMIKMNKEYNADFVLGSVNEPIDDSFPSKQRFGSSFRSQPKTRISFTHDESKEEENKSITSSKNKLRNYKHLKSQIFNNGSRKSNRDVDSIINNNNNDGDDDDAGNGKGRRHFHYKETFRSHIVIR